MLQDLGNFFQMNQSNHFKEYFNGNTGKGLGASHHTGWTALVAKLIQQSGPIL
jgi:hypothetical protein